MKTATQGRSAISDQFGFFSAMDGSEPGEGINVNDSLSKVGEKRNKMSPILQQIMSVTQLNAINFNTDDSQREINQKS